MKTVNKGILSSIDIVNYKPKYQIHFQKLNEQWINHYFKLEDNDVEVLMNPEKHIINQGGYILFAKKANHILGCIAMNYEGYGIFELNKMAVKTNYRNNGIGKMLIEACLEKARDKKAIKIILSTQKGLRNAIHIYESYGFRQMSYVNLKHSRSDVYMELSLK
ncbi:GNAT family N-acetyltransferase [Psychroserpens algicola]|uniref:GNAT family N-acetyltransferase n=1 Tax=Psychroserpens algicola TaxID=1719034 RepID=A0ABT0H5Z1_9FLAO|nr:GNAT family N-acetyltransferase [Psychroserpens algicola]MCK8479795.1 GNAT family N-acetyltransferase [Psychroserpens algicola]